MELFDIWEKNYKSRRYNKYPYNDIISFILKHFGKEKDKSSIKILELGCGGGNNLMFLKNEGFDFYAIDISDTSIEIVKNLLGKNFNKNKILKGCFMEIPFQNNFFDAIIDRASITCNETKDLPSIFNEIFRTLKSNGLFYSCTLFSDDHPELKKAKKVEKNDFKYFENSVFSAASQIHGFNETEIKKLLKKFKLYELTKVEKKTIMKNKKKLVESTFNLEAIK